ncbi:ATP-NAD kinase [Haloferax sp. Atlit-10N]|uniref:ATP-NAD kinase n=1 Tax=Haloferax prahovense (strain DSM 18310 / JCM 13924 / TL6) TaxID=1227461 RepID=M0GN77_HALPT|nr:MULTISPECIES: NAD(+)/NADH kinase [Haloferax]ELZ72998.1 ATP-NAD kinase [Haloferax prahovense DSM 18310]RDZ43667.1 ATP-NAD kinase [Haloferax sp. Atlit-19N]RDZ46435.1 ATP-NAD kinase [Haloferax sp. Atlit-16N]RDZ60268.1 ATP-NAD kinase [Haloferax sp. Atlit-10N]
MTTTIGLVVNPAAGRDIRRLTGGASVSNNYAKRRTAGCVLAGLTLVDDVEVLVMPDSTGLADRIVDDAPDDLGVEFVDMTVTASGRDSRAAAAHFADHADAVVVLGGDGTTRDVAQTIGDVPVVSISTGTNNVVPTPVDGTVAGAAAGLVGSGAVPTAEATTRHGTIEVDVVRSEETTVIRGLATVGVLDRPFVGTRAILDPSDIVGGVVSRSSPAEIGLSGIAGGLVTHRPDDPGGVGFRLARAGENEATAPTTVRAITVPGTLSTVDVAEHRVLDDREDYAFEVDRGVISVDGEREHEVRDGTVRLRPVSDGPRLVDVESVLERAADEGRFRLG